jgi:urease beta subunit
VTISNTGSAPLAFGAAPFTITGSEAGDFSQTSDCGATLAVDATCSVSVTFRPLAAGSRTATLGVSDDAPGSPQTVALSGTGAAPAPALSSTPTAVDFGSQLTGATSAPRTITLRNTGTGPLTFGATPFAMTGANAGEFAQTSDCGATLAVDATCSVSVTFSPGATGARSAALAVTDDAADSPQSVPLSGSGVPPSPAITVSPTTVAFGSRLVGSTSSAATVTVSNPGTAPLSIGSIAVEGSEAGDFARTTDCGSSLAVNASCTVSVTFTPGATGARSGSIVITDDAAGSPHSVGLTGTGIAPAATLTPTSLSFAGQVGTTSAAQTATLRNTGTATLNVSSIGFTGGDAGDFAQTNTCGATLAPSASCTISATFRPTVAGARASTLSVTDDAPGSPHTVAASGTGVYFAEDFESGNLSRWTIAGTGSATSQTTQKHAGNSAASLAASSTQSISMWSALTSAQTQTYTRFYFRWSGLTGTVPIAYGTDVNNNRLWEIDFRVTQRSPTVLVWNGARKQTSFNTSSGSIPANQWHSIELRVNEATAGAVEIWVDGTSMAARAPNLSVTAPYSRLYLADSAGGTAFFDDVFVSSTYTGP